jgi:hypothetical protein
MISVIIPAFREAERIGRTLAGVRRGADALQEPVEVIVVDDGSDDGTAEQALAADGERGRERDGETERGGDGERGRGSDRATVRAHLPVSPSSRPPVIRVVRLERNQGKGAALARGLVEARGEWIVMLDADLGGTAAEFPRLLLPVRAGDADMTIAVFPDARHQMPDASNDRAKQEWGATSEGVDHRAGPGDWRLATGASRSGFGLALRTARWGVARLTGRVLKAPLSGQRAFAAAHIPLLMPLEPGFGLEVGLDIDALWAGLRVLEVPTTMAHAATGRDWAGFRHRGRQMAHILRALARRALVSGKPGENATARKGES